MAIASTVLGIFVFWIAPIFVTVRQGRKKNRAGLAYGIILGWIGVLVLALLPPRLSGSRSG